MDWQRFDTSGTTLDLVVSGELFTLPAGKVGIAVGGQHRRDTWSADFPALQNAGQSDLQVAFTDTSASQSSNAVFAEVSVPLVKKDSFGAIDLTGAIRYENTGGPGLETTDPKVGLLYSTPSAALALRATWSTSFLAPTLYQRFRESAFFANGIDDPLTPGNDNLARLTTLISGNPDLEPQNSENYNLGFTWKPLEKLSLDVDYWHFTFDDQIAAENTVQLAADLATTLDPSKVIRSTAAGTVIYNGVNVGQIVGFNTTYINNAQLETAGVDFGISYSNDLGRFGTLRHSLQATYQTDYEINGVNAEGQSQLARGRRLVRRALAGHAAQQLVRGQQLGAIAAALHRQLRQRRDTERGHSREAVRRVVPGLGPVLLIRRRQAVRVEELGCGCRREQRDEQEPAMGSGHESPAGDDVRLQRASHLGAAEGEPVAQERLRRRLPELKTRATSKWPALRLVGGLTLAVVLLPVPRGDVRCGTATAQNWKRAPSLK